MHRFPPVFERAGALLPANTLRMEGSLMSGTPYDWGHMGALDHARPPPWDDGPRRPRPQPPAARGSRTVGSNDTSNLEVVLESEIRST